MSGEQLEGRIRAIEAVLLELHEVTPACIEAAKARSVDTKRRDDPKIAEAIQSALDNLKDLAQARQVGDT